MTEKRILIHLIAAARPNFMKVAPLYHALKEEAWCRTEIVHTGQHYDGNMSASFFADLSLPSPGVHLGIGSGTHAEQTAGVMVAYEKVLRDTHPDWVIVVGDVNSTLACTLAAKKLNVKVAHLEAGLRSFDRTMPEEINRLVTDTLSDILWTPSPDADENLRNEGIPEDRIVRVGNIMIDSLEMMRTKINSCRVWEEYGLPQGGYGVVTLHRPVNVDEEETLAEILRVMNDLSKQVPLVFPVHPRTRARLRDLGGKNVFDGNGRIHLTEPLAYTRFMSLVTNALFVVTDSGGIQEETTYLAIPCLTLRESTERPVTITQGTNRLVRLDNLQDCVTTINKGSWPKGRVPEMWDGRTAQRVVDSLKRRV